MWGIGNAPPPPAVSSGPHKLIDFISYRAVASIQLPPYQEVISDKLSMVVI